MKQDFNQFIARFVFRNTCRIIHKKGVIDDEIVSEIARELSQLIAPADFNYEGEICDNCGGHCHTIFDIKDEIWAKLPKEWNKSNVLCFECFLNELEKSEPDLELNLSDFWYLSFFGIKGIIRDKKPESRVSGG